MKIGTDGVLLGAWTPLINIPNSILDVGSGTGILALMLAQRSAAEQIDAIEIEPEAYEQCVENFENSSWSDRLFCYHAGWNEFVEEMEGETYDLIVSNPPFYSERYFSNDPKRDSSRFTSSLSFEDLLRGGSVLLSDKGIFSVIIPFKEETAFIKQAEKLHLYPFRLTHVKGTPSTEIKRSLIAFSKEKTVYTPVELILETSRHIFTDTYKELTKDFYVKL